MITTAPLDSDFKVIQLRSIARMGNPQVLGLGNDGLLYGWNRHKAEWFLYSSENLRKLS